MSGPETADSSLLAQALGAVALTFIVALLLAIAANALLFFGSAVVVLERFARSSKRFVHVLLITALWAALLGFLGTDEETVEGFGMRWPGVVQAWATFAAIAFGVVGFAEALIALVLRFVPPRARLRRDRRARSRVRGVRGQPRPARLRGVADRARGADCARAARAAHAWG